MPPALNASTAGQFASLQSSRVVGKPRIIPAPARSAAATAGRNDNAVVKLPITSSQLLGLQASEVSPEAVLARHQAISELPIEEGYSSAVLERRQQLLDGFADSLLAGWDSGAAGALVEVHTSAMPAVLSIMNEVGLCEQVLLHGAALMHNWDVRATHKRNILLAMALAHCGLAAASLACPAPMKVLEGCSHLEAALQLLREGGKPLLATGLVADAEAALRRFQRQHLLAIFQQQITPEIKKRRQQAVSELRTLMPVAAPTYPPVGPLLVSLSTTAGTATTASTPTPATSHYMPDALAPGDDTNDHNLHDFNSQPAPPAATPATQDSTAMDLPPDMHPTQLPSGTQRSQPPDTHPTQLPSGTQRSQPPDAHPTQLPSGTQRSQPPDTHPTQLPSDTQCSQPPDTHRTQLPSDTQRSQLPPDVDPTHAAPTTGPSLPTSGTLATTPAANPAAPPVGEEYAFEAMCALLPSEIVALHWWPDLASPPSPRPSWLSPDVARLAALAHMEAGLHQRNPHFFHSALCLLEALVPDRDEVLAELAVCNLLLARPGRASGLLLRAEALGTEGQPGCPAVEAAAAAWPSTSAGPSEVLDESRAAAFARRIGDVDANKGSWDTEGSPAGGGRGAVVAGIISTTSTSISTSTGAGGPTTASHGLQGEGGGAGSVQPGMGGVAGLEAGAAGHEEVLPLLGMLAWGQLWLAEVALPSLRAPPSGHIQADLSDYFFLIHPSALQKLPGSSRPTVTAATLRAIQHCCDLLTPPNPNQAPSTSPATPTNTATAAERDPTARPHVSLTAAVASGIRIVDVEPAEAHEVAAPGQQAGSRQVLPLAQLERAASERTARGQKAREGVVVAVRRALGGAVQAAMASVRGLPRRLSPLAQKTLVAAGLAAACGAGALTAWLVGSEAGRRALHRVAPGASVAVLVAQERIWRKLPGSYQDPPDEALTVLERPGSRPAGVASLDQATAELVVWHWQAARAAAFGPQHDVQRLEKVLGQPLLSQQQATAASFQESGRFLRIDLQRCQVAGVAAVPARALSEPQAPASSGRQLQTTHASVAGAARDTTSRSSGPSQPPGDQSTVASSSSSSSKDDSGGSGGSSGHGGKAGTATTGTGGTARTRPRQDASVQRAGAGSGSLHHGDAPSGVGDAGCTAFQVAVRVQEQVTLFGRDGSVAAAPASSYVELLTVREVPEGGADGAHGSARWRVCASSRQLS